MKKAIFVVLCVNAFLLAGRFWQEVDIHAQELKCATKNGDVNGDDLLDISDAIALLGNLFLVDPAELVPVCIAQDVDLTQRVSQLEEAVGALQGRSTLSDLTGCTAGQILKWSGTLWECVPDESGEPRVSQLEEAVGALQGRSTLSDLTGCTAGQIPKWSGTLWECVPDESGEPGLPAEQGEILSHMSIVELTMGQDEQGNDLGTAKTIRFTDVNVQIVNGLGATNGFPDDPDSLDPVQTATNGVGNLIVGYQELRGAGDDRTGSHNIVVGQRHSYSSFGGLVVGRVSTISGAYSSVSGGSNNTASGPTSSVSGGFFNTASGLRSSVSGGADNTASGDSSTVSGGRENQASGIESTVSGGGRNTASGRDSSVSGGGHNTASGGVSSVSGGQINTASGLFSSVSGGGGGLEGQGNTAEGDFSTVSGGRSVTVQDDAGHAP